MLNKTTETGAHKCELPFLDPTGDVVFFDVQSAEPGTFTVPGVIDLEVYEPGSLVESSWIYFKGDAQAGPQPGHPFERPFNDSVKFSIDIVDGKDTSTVIYPLMRGSISVKLSFARANRTRQHRRILLCSGKVVHHLVEMAITRCAYRDWTTHANTTVLARCSTAGQFQGALK